MPPITWIVVNVASEPFHLLPPPGAEIPEPLSLDAFDEVFEAVTHFSISVPPELARRSGDAIVQWTLNPLLPPAGLDPLRN